MIRCIGEAVMSEGPSTSVFFITMVLGVASVVSATPTFGNEKANYWRESSSGRECGCVTRECTAP